MKQRMKVREACALRGQRGEILVFDRDLVVTIFKHDNNHAVEVMRVRFRSRLGGIILFFLRRLRRLRLIGLGGSDRLMYRRARDCADQRSKNENDSWKQAPGRARPAGKYGGHLAFL